MYAFEKVNGLPVNGAITDADIPALEHPVAPAVLVPNGGPDRIEVDLGRQLLVLYAGNAVKLISHVSTGGGYYYCAYGRCRNAITPTGSFNVQRFVKGWETNDLGRLYNSTYIENEIGIAIHGSTSVPLYPASHGCVRLPMHIAEYFQNLVFIGENVFIV
jgi:lipoprotein-anchoring transpeptidase ErfK/SrfK